MALREVLADLRIRVTGGREVQRASRNVDSFVGRLRTAGTALRNTAIALGGAFAVREIARATREVIDFGDETAKTARALGIGADHLQRWRFAAERSGVEARALTNGLLRLQRNMVDASEGVAIARRAFADVGVEVRNSDGSLREIEDVLGELADGFRGLESDTQRSARAQQLFGRSGAQLLPFFAEGAEGIARLTARFDELGGALGDDFFGSAEEAQDALADFDVVLNSIQARLAATFLPTLTRLLNAFGQFAQAAAAVVQRSSVLETVMIALGAAAVGLGIALAPLALEALLVVAPFAALFFVVEDLVTAFRGGESVIGSFLDGLFGEGTTQELVEDLTTAFDGLWRSIQRAAAALQGEEFVDDRALSDGQAGEGQVRSAALSGRVIRRRGEGISFEQALERANAIRASEGLDPLAGGGLGSAVTGRGRGRGGTTVNTGDLRTVVNVNGAGDPARVAEEVQRQTQRAQTDGLNRALRGAAAALPSGGAGA